MKPGEAAFRADRTAIDAVKGVLLLLVILGHDTVLTGAFPTFFPVVNNFHVIGFLFLPFLFPSQRLSSRLLADRATRYLVPYVIFALAAAMVFQVFVAGPGEPSHRSGTFVLQAIARGNPASLKEATGFSAFWFLPALLSTVLVRGLFVILTRALRVAFLLTTLAFHASAGVLSQTTLHASPMGLSVAIFVFPLAYLAAAVAPWTPSRRFLVGAVSLPVAVCCAVYAAVLGSVSNVGAMTVYGWDRIGRLVLHDVYAFTAFLTVVALGPSLSRLQLFRSLGRESLAIYLTHLFVLQAYAGAARALGVRSVGLVGLANVAVSIVVGVGGSWLAARIITQTRLKRWIFPNSAADWPPLQAIFLRSKPKTG